MQPRHVFFEGSHQSQELQTIERTVDLIIQRNEDDCNPQTITFYDGVCSSAIRICPFNTNNPSRFIRLVCISVRVLVFYSIFKKNINKLFQ